MSITPASAPASPTLLASGEQPTPGAAGDSFLLRHLPAHIYHADRDALSCSLLKPLLVSPAHFRCGLTATPTASDARDLGTLVHLLLLQPHLVGSELAVFPGVPARGELAEFALAYPDRLVVDEPTFAQGNLMAEKVAGTLYRGRRLQNFIAESIPEATIYFTEPITGLRLRVRLDLYHPDFTFDLKTTRFALTRPFMRDAVDKDYDLQAYMYSLARALYEGNEQAKPFVFVKVENGAPHSVGILAAGESFIGNGAKKFQACVSSFMACTQQDYWPDLTGEDTLEIEPWQQFGGRLAWQEALNATAP